MAREHVLAIDEHAAPARSCEPVNQPLALRLSRHASAKGRPMPGASATY
jgi:hypothetical protein